MRAEQRYIWRVNVAGKRCTTFLHMTAEQVWRDYPEGEPEAVLETLQVHQVPETAAEMLAQFERAPIGHGRAIASKERGT